MKYFKAIGVTLAIMFITHNLFASAMGFFVLFLLTAKENETNTNNDNNSGKTPETTKEN